jgi:integrase
MGKVRLKVKKLPSGLQFNGERYTIDKIIDGTRIKKRLKSTSLQDVLEEYALIITSVKKGQFASKTASSLTVDDVLIHYYETHLVNIKSGKNAKFHIPALSKYLGTKTVLSLKRYDIDRYKMIQGKSRDISPRTLQAELQHLNMAINRAMDDELIPRNPISRFCKVTVPRRRKIVLDHGVEFGPQWVALYRNVPKQWRLFTLICYETGMRPAEVTAMETSWVRKVTQDDLMITVPAEKEKTGFNDRRIPVSKILQKRLQPIVESATGKIFKSFRYDKAFRKAVQNANLGSEITAYALRRTRATIWDAIDSQAARVALGHVPLDPHEESYVEITNERLFRLVNVNFRPVLKLLKPAHKTG